MHMAQSWRDAELGSREREESGSVITLSTLLRPEPWSVGW